MAYLTDIFDSWRRAVILRFIAAEALFGSGEYVDYDFSALINLTDNFGVQGGYRSLDLNVTSNEDVGRLKLEGAYFGALLRF